jgi:hypothetical protein
MRRILLVSVSCLGFVFTQPALAGFEWSPPANAPRAINAMPQMEPQQPQSAGPLTPEPITPVAIEPLLESDLDSPPPMPMQSRRVPQQQDSMAMSEPEILTGNNMNSPQVFVPSNGVASRVDGFGRRVPLSMALKQIVPPLYVYKFSKGVTPKQKVSWEGGDTWVNVLNNMLDQSDLSGSLNGNVITITKGTGSVITLRETPTLMPTSQESLMGGVSPSPIVDLQTHKTWTARSGVSLREALQSWARQANVQLEWQTNYNYPISSVFNFEGTFDQAVDSLLSLYGEDQSPPKGKLYPNQPNGPSVLLIESL